MRTIQEYRQRSQGQSLCDMHDGPDQGILAQSWPIPEAAFNLLAPCGWENKIAYKVGNDAAGRVVGVFRIDDNEPRIALFSQLGDNLI